MPRGRADGSVLFLIGALAVAAALRLALADYSLWFDEFASVFFAGQPLRRLWSAWMLRETNPPLYYTLLHVWIGWFGLHPLALRGLSILASLAAMVVVYAGVRAAYGMRGAMLAVAMLAVSAQQLFFAQQVRAYMLLFLAVAVSFFGLMQLARTETHARTTPPLRAWLAYAGGAVAAVYLHTTALLWPGVATLALLLAAPGFRDPRRGLFWRLVAADTAILVGTAWWLAITWQQLHEPKGDISWMAKASVGQMLWTLRAAILLARGAQGVMQLAPLAVGALALFGAVRSWHLAATRLAVACLGIAGLLFIALSLVQPILIDRTVLWLSLFPLTLAAAGLAAIRDLRIASAIAAVVIGLLAVNLVQSLPSRQSEDWLTPVATAARDPKAMVIVNGEAMSVALDMACAVEIGRHCPFSITAMVGPERQPASWANGAARRVGQSSDGRAVFPDAHAYLFRRPSQDAFKPLREAGLIGPVAPVFVGPMSAEFLTALAARSRVADGVVVITGR